MRKTLPLLMFALMLALPSVVIAQAETESLVLGLSKEFGYAAGGTIQGTFTLKVRSPDDLIRVDFIIDGKVVYTDTEAPFKYQFNTADFSTGRHRFSGIGYRADGSQVYADEFWRQFITGEQAWVEVKRITVPLLLGIGALTVLGTLATALLGREKQFQLGQYGLAGGAVCPQCQLPYSRSMLAPNLVVGKLQRCPHCGKWAIVSTASSRKLEEAEARFRQRGVDDVEFPSREDTYRRLLDESRYE